MRLFVRCVELESKLMGWNVWNKAALTKDGCFFCWDSPKVKRSYRFYLKLYQVDVCLFSSRNWQKICQTNLCSICGRNCANKLVFFCWCAVVRQASNESCIYFQQHTWQRPNAINQTLLISRTTINVKSIFVDYLYWPQIQQVTGNTTGDGHQHI